MQNWEHLTSFTTIGFKTFFSLCEISSIKGTSHWGRLSPMTGPRCQLDPVHAPINTHLTVPPRRRIKLLIRVWKASSIEICPSPIVSHNLRGERPNKRSGPVRSRPPRRAAPSRPSTAKPPASGGGGGDRIGALRAAPHRVAASARPEQNRTGPPSRRWKANKRYQYGHPATEPNRYHLQMWRGHTMACHITSRHVTHSAAGSVSRQA